jgi:hypothetical protein
MSFFAGLAQGVQNGIPLGQAYLEAKNRKKRESVLSQYGAGAYKGDPNALAQIAGIDPAAAQELGQNALAMQSAQRAHQMQGIAAGLAYFHDANTPQEFEARKAAWSKTPYADLVPPEQLTFENKDRLIQMATAYTRGMAPWEIEQAKTVAQQARVELDRSKAEMGAMAGAAIGQARGLLPDEPYRQPGGTTPPFNPAIGPERERPARNWIRYTNENATRSQPLSDKLVSAMDFLPEMGVTMEVFSGGQPVAGEGGARTGSTRHDQGNAADVFFYKDGRKLDWNNPEDRPIFEEIVQRGKARGITGFGAGEGYMQPGSMHIGFGDPAVWGAGGKGVNAADWLRGAYQAERARDAVVANNPALAGYVPRGPISEDQAALMRPPQVTDEEFAQRARRIEALGIEPNSPEGQEYLLTGKLPDRPKPSDLAKRRETLDAAGVPADSPQGRHYLLTGQVKDEKPGELANRRETLDAAGVPADSPQGRHYLLTGQVKDEKPGELANRRETLDAAGVPADSPQGRHYLLTGQVKDEKPGELANRRETLDAAGYAEDSPLGRHYLLTGEVPKPDEDKLAERRRMLAAADMPEDSKAGQHYLLTGKLPSGKSIVVGADGSVTIAEGDGVFDLTKPRINATQEQIQNAEKNLAEMRRVQEEMKDEYLTYAGGIKGAIGTVLDKTNSESLDAAANYIFEQAGSDMDADDFKEFSAYMRTAVSRVDRAFLMYRKDVTGTAGAAQELAEIKRAGLNGDLSPRQFNMRLEQWIDGLEADLARNRAALQGGIGGEPQPAPRQPAPNVGGQAIGPMPVVFSPGETKSMGPAQPEPQAPAPQATEAPGPSIRDYQDTKLPDGTVISGAEQYFFDSLVRQGVNEQEAFQRTHERFHGGVQ